MDPREFQRVTTTQPACPIKGTNCSSIIPGPTGIIGSSLPLLDKKKHNNLQGRSLLAINKSSGEWKRVLLSLRHYYAINQFNAHSVVLAAQMLLIALRSFQNRVEIGGWAGDFVRSTFVYSIDEMAQKNINWNHPPGTKGHLGLSGHNSHGDYLFSAKIAGDEHFARHLEPSFKNYVFKGMHGLVDKVATSSNERGRQYKQVKDFLKDLTLEHENFIQYAVIPSFKEIDELFGVFRKIGGGVVEDRARALRKKTIWNEVVNLYNKKLITERDARWFLKKADIHSMSALYKY